MKRGQRLFVSLGLSAVLAGCGMERDTHPTAAGGLHASLTSEVTSEAALLVGNLTNPAPRAGNGILRYNAGDGAFIDAIAPEGSGPTTNPLVGPCCMAFGPDENLYVSNLFGPAIADRAVFRYNGVTGEFMDVFIPGASGGLVRPLVLVFGPDGNLYVRQPHGGTPGRVRGDRRRWSESAGGSAVLCLWARRKPVCREPGDSPHPALQRHYRCVP